MVLIDGLILYVGILNFNIFSLIWFFQFDRGLLLDTILFFNTWFIWTPYNYLFFLLTHTPTHQIKSIDCLDKFKGPLIIKIFKFGP